MTAAGEAYDGPCPSCGSRVNGTRCPGCGLEFWTPGATPASRLEASRLEAARLEWTERGYSALFREVDADVPEWAADLP